MSSFNQCGCFVRGGPLDGLLCRRCTCEWCGNNLRNGFCSFCASRSGNSFVYDPNLNSFNNPPNVFNHPPQPQTYSCELSGNDSHYRFDCPPRASVEDLVPIPSKFEDTSDKDSKCDLPFFDDSFPLDVLRGNSVTFSNSLFDYNDDFTSSDDESLPEEDVPEKNFKIYSNPLFEFDDKYIFSDVNPIFNEVLEDIKSKDSYVFKLDEPTLIVTHISELNEDECFDPGGDEIEACLPSDSISPGIDGVDFDPEGDILLLLKLLNDDISFSLPPKELNFKGLTVIKYYIPSDFKDDYYDSEGDIIYLESLFINDTIPYFPPEVFLDHDPRSLKDEPDNDLKSMVKVSDPGIHEKIISSTHVRLPFEDRHYFPLTFVIKIFLPFLIYIVNSLPLLSSGSENLIFDPGISAYSFYSLEPMAYESPMMIFPFFCFCLKDKGIRGESS
ncbi:hypothetical protein Tco_1094222 [Tanacetum coccineum]|uniref:Pre-mRNA splicing Prp18-interacting factor n=1 Tax=Tanacetum coccineum TaxID=301880 RepID=A0ABQ5IGA8_9ASTR